MNLGATLHPFRPPGGDAILQQRRLGRNGPPISAMGLGCMGMSGTYGDYDEAEAVETIHRALELGINLIDTADAVKAIGA